MTSQIQASFLRKKPFFLYFNKHSFTEGYNEPQKVIGRNRV